MITEFSLCLVKAKHLRSNPGSGEKPGSALYHGSKVYVPRRSTQNEAVITMTSVLGKQRSCEYYGLASLWLQWQERGGDPEKHGLGGFTRASSRTLWGRRCSTQAQRLLKSPGKRKQNPVQGLKAARNPPCGDGSSARVVPSHI